MKNYMVAVIAISIILLFTGVVIAQRYSHSGVKIYGNLGLAERIGKGYQSVFYMFDECPPQQRQLGFSDNSERKIKENTELKQMGMFKRKFVVITDPVINNNRIEDFASIKAIPGKCKK